MECIKVLKPGLLTTVQDLGRPNFRRYGVSVSGVMDHYSFRIANILVGNNENEAGLEITLIGPSLEFIRGVSFAITGADLSPTLNGESIPLWSVIKAKHGDVLRFGFCQEGCRSYIAFSGGLDVPEVMGSKSTFLRGNYGGFWGRALIKGDILALHDKAKDIPKRRLRFSDIPNFQERNKIRFIQGPHEIVFEPDSIATFLSEPYIVSNAADRMGYRLEGEKLVHKNSADIISDFITVGTIQIPGNGLPIIHMADCGTSGGYTKMGVIISSDIPMVAQLKPGDRIDFEKVEIKDAINELAKKEQFLKQLKVNNRFLVNV